MHIDWHFDTVKDDSQEGWNESAIAAFKQNRLKNLVRETIQNSLDAARPDPESLVTVEFKNEFKSVHEIPGIETLKEAVNCCELSALDETPESLAEIKEAKRILDGDKIRVLSISDSGTIGMQGPCESGQPFFRYLKTRGQSKGDDRTGSHGIGKAAPLCVSNLRTIIASSVWEEEDGKQDSLIQGRATLMTHQYNGETRKNIGYWGEGFNPIRNEDCPEQYRWIVHSGDVGTTIHILGWSPGEGRTSQQWKDCIFGYAAISFFAAFQRKRLVLIVDGKELDAKTISNVLSLQGRFYETMRGEDQHEELSATKFFYDCLNQGSDVIKEELQLDKGLKDCSLHMILSDDAPHKIAFVRNDMLITDCVPGFWKRKMLEYRGFAGVFECKNEMGRKLLRSMEPPEHNKLNSDCLPDGEQKIGKERLRHLSDRLKKVVKKYATPPYVGGDKADFMKEFLSDDADVDMVASHSTDEEINLDGKIVISNQASSFNPSGVPPLDNDEEDLPIDDDGDNGGAGTGGGGGGDRPGDGEGHGDGEGGTGESGYRTDTGVPLRNVRIVKTEPKTARIYMTCDKKMRARITIKEVGAYAVEELKILSSSTGSLLEGDLLLDLHCEGRNQVIVSFERSVFGGLKLSAISAQTKEQS